MLCQGGVKIGLSFEVRSCAIEENVHLNPSGLMLMYIVGSGRGGSSHYSLVHPTKDRYII